VSDTRARILETARALFNEHGLHRVGVRDIARAMEMSPGNLAYHFPTKDALVSALVLELHDLNQRTVFADVRTELSLVAFYRTAIAAMRNILQYRFVLLSYVDVVLASPELQKLEVDLAPARRRRSDTMLALLADGGWLDRRRLARATYLYEQGQMISSGWLAAAALTPGAKDDDDVVLHYAKVGAALLEPYCTPKGARQMRRILAGGYDAEKAARPPSVARKRRAQRQTPTSSRS
jgi:AcrR family transcriptional regulator